MSKNRRLYQKGGLYFFTVVTHERRPILCKENALLRLKAAFQYTLKKYPLKINGLVILPDHLHSIWQLPEDDNDFSIRWNMIKRYFSIGIKGEANKRGEKTIWQRRFWEHLIRDEKDMQRCFDYLQYNPVKHGYVDKSYDWPHSSFQQHVKNGIYQKDWGSIVEPYTIKKLELE